MSEQTGQSEEKILAKIRREWEEGGKKQPEAKAIKPILTQWVQRRETVNDVKQQLVKAQAQLSETVLAMARLFGCQSLKIDGVVYDFASKGSTVFLRTKSGEIVDIS